MTYDPFERGQFPVGVQTQTWQDVERDRHLTVEIWYPASEANRGRDGDPATWDTFVPVWAADSFEADSELAHQEAVRGAEWSSKQSEWPLVLLVHGWAGYRQESSFLGTHLASSGYVVVSPDVTGSTWADVDSFLTGCEPESEADVLLQHTTRIAEARVGDVSFLIDAAIDALPVRPHGVGVTGASFGGYSSLVAPSADERVSAVAAMCPANDDAPIVAPHRPFEPFLRADWKSDAATLILAADRDSLLPLYGQLGLLRSLPATDKTLVALAHADHNHFVDEIDIGQAWLGEFAARVARLFPHGPGDWAFVARSVQPMDRLVPAVIAQTAWRGVVAAHFDAHLKDEASARVLLLDLAGMLSGKGIEATVIGVTSAEASP